MRPRGSGGRAPPVTPMSERQQMALLMQMTNPSNPSSSSASSSTSATSASSTSTAGGGGASNAGAGGRSPSAVSSTTSRSRDRNERGETPLHLAAIKGDVDQVNKLLAHKADPNVTDFAGWTPLHEACNHGWYEVANRLIQAGASVNARGLDDDTPLHDAASNGHQKLVKLLVDNGADSNAKNKKGKSPIDVAAPRVLTLLYANNTANTSSLRATVPESGTNQRQQGRGVRDDKKLSESKKCLSPSESMDTSSSSSTAKNTATTSANDDIYEFKSVKETSNSPDPKATDPLEIPSEAVDPLSIPASQNQLEEPTVPKRSFADLTDPLEDISGGDEDTKRKKRKDSDAGKDNTSKPMSQTGRNNSGPNKANTGKPGSTTANKSISSASKSPCSSPKPTNQSSDAEVEDGKSDLKVPPLKIVIPQSSTSEQETGGTRNGKNSSQRHNQALPYVVASSNSAAGGGNATGGSGNTSGANAGESNISDKDGAQVSGTTSPTDSSSGKTSDDKKEFSGTLNEEQRSGSSHHQRVLRSSHRSSGSGGGGSGSGNTANDRASNNSSPQLQRSHSPSPSASPATPSTTISTTQASSSSSANDTPNTSSTTSASNASQNNTNNNAGSNSNSNNASSTAGNNTSSKPTSTTSNINNSNSTNNNNGNNSETQSSNSSEETLSAATSSTSSSSSAPAPASTPSAPVELHPRKRKLRPNKEQPSTAPPQDSVASTSGTSVHPHEQPITNCYQLFLNIRKQIERRRKNLFPVQPKPPQGFKDYLMNRCTYVLAHNAPPQPTVVPPPSVPTGMRDTYIEQEKERYKLRMQHVIQKEKLVLSVEQEILRVHGLAARTLANQTLPFSVCTVLRDEEVYNVITPEQEEKDRNARSRYNGRLFLSWLQDVDDKWEKIKEAMLLRHHNEAESLHAVQRMDWEWKLKELSLCDYNATPQIDELHVPMVHVSDDFDLLPA